VRDGLVPGVCRAGAGQARSKPGVPRHRVAGLAGATDA
jgi:hypothetical protein